MDQEVFPDLASAKRWFRKAGFGLFVHWGLYAIPAGSWIGSGEMKSV